MCPPEEEENNGSTKPKRQAKSLADTLLERAIPFLEDEAAKYEDDGSNEPLELIRDIRCHLHGVKR